MAMVLRAALLSCVFAGAALGNVYTWDGGLSHGGFTSDNKWSTANNWVNGSVPVDGPTTDIVFTLSGIQTTSFQNIGNPLTLHSITFDANNFNYTAISGSKLSFVENGGGDPSIEQDSSVNVLISNDLQMTSGNTLIKGNGTGSVFLGGALSGRMVVSAKGTVALIGSGNNMSMLVTSKGTLVIAANVTATDIENDGVMTVKSGATVSGPSSVALIAGSTTTVESGGAITAPVSDTVELNGLLVNNGTIGSNGSAKVNINSGGVAKGAGNYAGGYSVNSGGTISPGNSPGVMTSGASTWGGGGTYLWEINDASGSAGAGWDLSVVEGLLTIGATTASKFTLELESLAGGTPGSAAGFDPTHSYQWAIAQESGGLVGFDPAKFVVDSSGFLNPTNGGKFSLSVAGNNQTMFLNFTAAPEPGMAGVLMVGALGMMVRRRRLYGGS